MRNMLLMKTRKENLQVVVSHGLHATDSIPANIGPGDIIMISQTVDTSPFLPTASDLFADIWSEQSCGVNLRRGVLTRADQGERRGRLDILGEADEAAHPGWAAIFFGRRASSYELASYSLIVC